MKKIAVPSQGNQVSAHFGHAPEFKMFSVDNGEIKNEEVVKNPGHQPGLLPRLLRDEGADIIISGGMGQKAIALFEKNDIEVICGAAGDVNSVINSYLAGSLNSQDNRCSHGNGHDHDHHDHHDHGSGRNNY